MSEYVRRIISVSVMRPGDSLYAETVTTVTVIKEGGEEFVEVVQRDEYKIEISAEEWPALREAIDFMISECKP